jgi:hypothetical protein
MNATLERRISALIHGSLGEMRSFASALSLRLRHLVKPSLRSKRLDIRELRGFGGIRPDYDHKALRTGDNTRRP